MKTVRIINVIFIILISILLSCSNDKNENGLNIVKSNNGEIRGYYLSTVLWDPDINSDVTTIIVCWENPDATNITERNWVREAINKTWASHSLVNFAHWEQCDENGGNIRIRIEDTNNAPHTISLGTTINNRENGMSLNFTYQNWGCCQRDLSGNCRTDLAGNILWTPCNNTIYSDWDTSRREHWIRTNAIHEFGHALGLAHEHNRDDRPSDCTNDPQGTDGDTTVGSFDRDSIMNYCFDSTYNGQLSTGDIETVQQMYGICDPRPCKGSRSCINEENDGCLSSCPE